jgi:hypothetical protein
MRVLIVDPREWMYESVSTFLGPGHHFDRVDDLARAEERRLAARDAAPYDVVLAADDERVEGSLEWLGRIKITEPRTGTVLVTRNRSRRPNALVDVVADEPLSIETLEQVLDVLERRSLRVLARSLAPTSTEPDETAHEARGNTPSNDSPARRTS